jgi:hypothetical protein
MRIAQSQNSALWCIARSRNSALCGEESRIGAMPYRVEFFGIARSRNKILSSFTETVKVTVYQKIGIGDLACPMAVK